MVESYPDEGEGAGADFVDYFVAGVEDVVEMGGVVAAFFVEGFFFVDFWGHFSDVGGNYGGRNGVGFRCWGAVDEGRRFET